MAEQPLPPGVTAEDVKAFQRLTARAWIVSGLLVADTLLEELDRFSARAEAEGPKYFPDIWRANAKGIMEDREMLRALAACRRDVLTTSPSLIELGPFLEGWAEQFRPRLEAAFRDVFSRPDVAAISPLVILTALVRYVARLTPDVVASSGR